MIELRWVIHPLTSGAPPIGSICVGDRIYQRLQYRFVQPCIDASGALTPGEWSDWMFVTFGMPLPDVPQHNAKQEG